MTTEEQVKLSRDILQLYLCSGTNFGYGLDTQHLELMNLAVATLTQALQPINKGE